MIATHHPAELQKRHFERDFRSAARAAEKNASAGRHKGLYGLAQDGGLRRCLQRKAHTVTGDFSDFSHDVGPAGVVDHVRRAKLTREHQTLFMDVHGDDRIAARDPGRHEGGKSHGSDTEHGERVPRLSVASH